RALRAEFVLRLRVASALRAPGRERTLLVDESLRGVDADAVFFLLAAAQVALDDLAIGARIARALRRGACVGVRARLRVRLRLHVGAAVDVGRLTAASCDDDADHDQGSLHALVWLRSAFVQASA